MTSSKVYASYDEYLESLMDVCIDTPEEKVRLMAFFEDSEDEEAL